MCEQLILRYLRTVPKASGRQISEAVCIALPLVREVTNKLKTEKCVIYVGTNVVGDFICELTGEGLDGWLDWLRLIR